MSLELSKTNAYYPSTKKQGYRPPSSPTEKQTWTLLRVAIRSCLRSLRHNIGECITIPVLSNSYKTGKN